MHQDPISSLYPPAVCRCNISAGQCAWSSAVNHSAVLPQHTVHYHQYADSVRLCLAFKVHHITYGRDAAFCCSQCGVVYLPVCWHDRELSKNGWPDQDSVWEEHSCGPKEPCIRWGSRFRSGIGQFWTHHFLTHCLQCFDAVGWAAGRASGL